MAVSQSPATLVPALIAIALALFGTEARSAETFLALGKVESTGSLASYSARSGASVVSTRLSAGLYQVSIVQSGAFQGKGMDDYVIEAGIESVALGDAGITATIDSITNDTLVVHFQTADLENSGSPNDAVAVDQAFFFAVRESPDSGSIEGETRHLLAVGLVNGSGFLERPHIAVGGGTLLSVREAAGNYDLSLERPGAFANDAADDYLILLTSLENGTEDAIPRGEVKSTLLDGSVSFTIRNHDLQANPAGNAGVPADGDMAFAVYQIRASEMAGVPASRLVALTASVAGTDGSKINGASSRPGSTVLSARSSTGVYTVTLVSPGAFRGSTNGDFAPIVTLRGELLDRVASAQCSVINEDTLQVTVRIKDVQVSGQAEGVLADNDFDLVVYDLDAKYASDLAVGTRRAPAALRYFGKQGKQIATVNLRSTDWGKFYVGAENTGRSVDGVVVFVGYQEAIKEQYFLLGRRRINVTAKIRQGVNPVAVVRPGERIYMEGGVRYKSAKERTPTRKFISGSSGFSSNRSLEYPLVRIRPR